MEKINFFAPGTLVDQPLAPTVRGPGCPPAPPIDNWYGGLSGSLADSEAWKPQKVEACGWTRRKMSLINALGILMKSCRF